MLINFNFLHFSNLDRQQKVLLAQDDSVSKVADGFEVVGNSGNVIVGKCFCYRFCVGNLSFAVVHAAIANVEKKLYGIQFHPEDDRFKNGKKMLKNFLFNVADLSANFTLKYRVNKSIDHIRQVVGTNKVFVSSNFINHLKRSFHLLMLSQFCYFRCWSASVASTQLSVPLSFTKHSKTTK